MEIIKVGRQFASVFYKEIVKILLFMPNTYLLVVSCYKRGSFFVVLRHSYISPSLSVVTAIANKLFMPH